jgi:hypothetical protein
MSLHDKLAAIRLVLENWNALADAEAALREASSAFHAQVAQDVNDLKRIASNHESRLADIEEALSAIADFAPKAPALPDAGTAPAAAGSTNDAPGAVEPQAAAPASSTPDPVPDSPPAPVVEASEPPVVDASPSSTEPSAAPPPDQV